MPIDGSKVDVDYRPLAPSTLPHSRVSTTMTDSRGSEWAKWDLHVHSPASFNWRGGKNLGELDTESREATLKEWVSVINASDVAVFAVMDYWSFDGILALRDYRRRNEGALQKTVLPGIELRVQSPQKKRLNIHAILSDRLTDQQLRDFMACLKLQVMDGSERRLSHEALQTYARALRDDQLDKASATRDQLKDDDRAWRLGCEVAEVTLASFQEAMRSLQRDSAVVLQPWDTYGGLRSLEWWNHYTSAHILFSQPDIFECKDEPTRDALLGRRTESNAHFYEGFWQALGKRPRLPIRGSDAHSFADYGRFQSELPTWLKAAPTFRGLLQAIKEPGQRSYLGELPPKLQRVRSKPSRYIDTVRMSKVEGHGLEEETWFDGQEIRFNTDLVAIIGNKGSGKSALADVLALLGDTDNVDSFSFLSPIRFRDKKSNRARQFQGHIAWKNGESWARLLSKDPDPSSVERVRYIPQSYFERVCSGQSEEDLREFTRQIENVIFAHVPEHLREGAEDLEALLDRHERETVRRVTTLREELKKTNAEICRIRRKTSRSARNELAAELALRNQQLEDLKAVEPPEPQAESTPPDDPRVERLNTLLADQVKLREEEQDLKKTLVNEQAKYEAASRLQPALEAISRYVEKEVGRLKVDAARVGLDIARLVELKIDKKAAAEVLTSVGASIDSTKSKLTGNHEDSVASRLTALESKLGEARNALGAAQVTLQAQRERRAAWKREIAALKGAADEPQSIAHVERQIAAIDAGPDLIQRTVEARDTLAKEIASTLLKIRASREDVVKTARSKIEHVIPQGFSLDFINEIHISGLEERFFQLVKRVTGTFRGEEEGRRAFRDYVDSCELDGADNLLALATGIEKRLVTEEKGDGTVEHDLDTLVRKGHSAEEVLNLLYGFDYIKPRFTLAQGGQVLTQLSPGQRGAMLLVFFLLVEDSDLPVVLDQPEENLDNETVYSLLVPVIKRAKERRQIVMVTHNANLAVCCDAEQVVHASFDRSNGHTMVYRSGPIENPTVNALVVDVLEGTRPAFDDRRQKYGFEERVQAN